MTKSKKSDAARKVRQQSENYTENDRTVLSSLAESYLLENNLSEAFIQDRTHFLEDRRSVMKTLPTQSAIATLGQDCGRSSNSEQRIPHLEEEKHKLDKQIDDKLSQMGTWAYQALF